MAMNLYDFGEELSKSTIKNARRIHTKAIKRRHTKSNKAEGSADRLSTDEGELSRNYERYYKKSTTERFYDKNFIRKIGLRRLGETGVPKDNKLGYGNGMLLYGTSKSSDEFATIFHYNNWKSNNLIDKLKTKSGKELNVKMLGQHEYRREIRYQDKRSGKTISYVQKRSVKTGKILK